MGATAGKPTQSTQTTKGRITRQNSSNSTPESQVDLIIQALTINVFFDGTKNNMYNIDSYGESGKQRAIQAAIKRLPTQSGAYESYTNAYSNVVHLFKAVIPNVQNVINIYVEGMGSAKGKRDDQRGFALGSGQTGITSRAEKAVEEIMRMTKPYKQSSINLIKINVFGFSRGAATARHFLSKLKAQRDLSVWDIPMSFRVHFVGLFDTVSSFDDRSMSEVFRDTTKYVVGQSGNNTSHLPEFNNDIAELGLAFDAGEYTHPLKVFQIYAGDEYRTFFSLTDIQSARLGRGLGTGFGCEIILPGAHSDIGGSYPDGIDEEYECSPHERGLAQWLIGQGFYNKEQASTWIKDLGDGTTHFKRTNIPFDAYMIALKVMYEMAIQQGGMKGVFNESHIHEVCDSSYPIIKTLVESIPTQVINKLKSTGWSGNATAFNFSSHYPDLKAFRNQFIHWSAKKETGYEVRRSLVTDAYGDFQQVAADTNFMTAATFDATDLLHFRPKRGIHYG